MPSPELLAGYRTAVGRGWSPRSSRDDSAEHAAAIDDDPAAFLADVLAQSGTITLPDGRSVPKLPSRVRWMIDRDGQFCGQISLRWVPGTDTLPAHVLGHIGYTVVPWQRRKGHGTEALRLMLAEAREVGLTRVELTTDEENIASQRTIERCGGRRAGTVKSSAHGPDVKLLYVIDLSERPECA